MNNGNARNPYKDLDGKKNVTGSNINYYRIKKNYSVQQLSDRLIMLGLDLHRQSIFLIESGKRTVSDYELAAIAEVLDVTPNDLLAEFSKHLKTEKNKNIAIFKDSENNIHEVEISDIIIEALNNEKRKKAKE